MPSVLPGLDGIGVFAIGNLYKLSQWGDALADAALQRLCGFEGEWWWKEIGDQGMRQLKRSPGSEMEMEGWRFCNWLSTGSEPSLPVLTTMVYPLVIQRDDLYLPNLFRSFPYCLCFHRLSNKCFRSQLKLVSPRVLLSTELRKGEIIQVMLRTAVVLNRRVISKRRGY